MLYYLILIIVGMAGVVVGMRLARKWKRGKASREEAGEVEEIKEREDAKKKRENLEKTRAIFVERGRLANDDLEKELAVSDATATRYLDELEKEGFIRQVGQTGKRVYYEKIGQ